MIEYRSFLNTDPPGIVDIWNNQPAHRARVEYMTMGLLEELVLSIPYFCHQDFICAVENGLLVGFVHVATVPPPGDFGGENENELAPSKDGVICQLLVYPDREDRHEITRQLLDSAEQRLVKTGHQRIYINSRFPDCPFYLGLYGGSCIPGVFAADKEYADILTAHGYKSVEDIIVMQRNLFESKPTVNRSILSMRRSYQLVTRVDAPVENWWLACSFGKCERTEFQILPKMGGAAVGGIEYLDLHEYMRQWNARSFGMNYIEIDEASRRSGLASFLIEESLRSLHAQGVELVEGQVSARNKVIVDLLQKCSFKRIERATQFAKVLG